MGMAGIAIKEIRSMRHGFDAVFGPPVALDDGAGPSGTPWVPHPGPQTDVIETDAFETLYGGAAGPGKTCLIVNLARLYHRSSLLLRRTYPQLEDSLILEAKKWYPVGCYNSTKHVANLPDGRRVRFGHLEHDDDMYQYQSAEFDLIAFDELTQFNLKPYLYLLSRLRTTIPGQRVRVVNGSNPGNTGQEWVVERWAPWLDPTHSNPAKPGEIRYFKRLPNDKEIETTADDPEGMSRTFIPARLCDNPTMPDEYRHRLAMLPEPFRSQLLNGDWSVAENDDPYQVIPTAWVLAAMARHATRTNGETECIGCDSAHGGRDCTVRAFSDAGGISRLLVTPGKDTPDSQSVVALLIPDMANPAVVCNMDAMPPGAFDLARGNGMNVNGINFGAGCDEKDKSGTLKFRNMRAFLYWNMRDLLDPSSDYLVSLPNDPELLAELTAPRFKPEIGGITITPKDDIKKRLRRSPDKADAAVLAVYRPRRREAQMFIVD